MSSIDKLIKAFEFLKIQPVDDASSINYNESISPKANSDIKQLNKREKIQNLNIVHENIINENVRQTEEYVKLLTHSIEIFILYIDDQHEQDVQFVAEECLNKTIKALIDTNLGRIQVDLCRFIKKNGAEKCFKIALMRFADLSHLIRPQKCRHFAEFLVKENIIKKIAQRQEESIQNVLIDVMLKLSDSLCSHMNDAEIKILLDSFIPNLADQSPVNTYRRVAAACLPIICFHSKNPMNSYSLLFNELTKLISFDETNKINKYSANGVIQCFRNIIQNIAELDLKVTTVTHISYLETTLLKIYEICIYYIDSNNKNNKCDLSLLIISLECVCALYKYAPFNFGKTIILKENEMLIKFVRLISQNFLLAGKRGLLMADLEVKVLIKTLAIECITNAVSFKPDIIQLTLQDDQTDGSQYLYDVLLYINHNDEKLKTNVCLLMGNLIYTVLLKYSGNYAKWLKKSKNEPNELKLEVILSTYKKILEENDNNLSKKAILSQLKQSVPLLLDSKYAKLTIELIVYTFHLKYSTYNLIKYELVDFLATLNFNLINFISNNNSIQQYILNDIFLYILRSNDSKLRQNAARMFTVLVKNLYSLNDNLDNLLRLEYLGKFSSIQCFYFNLNLKSFNSTKAFRHLLQTTDKSVNFNTRSNINYLVPLLLNRLLESQQKYEIYGILESFQFLFEIFEPFLYLNQSLTNDLLDAITQFINQPSILLDLYAHNLTIKLINHLYCASLCNYMYSLDIKSFINSSNYNGKWRLISNSNFLISTSEKLLAHIMKLLCIISYCIDDQLNINDTNLSGFFNNNQIYIKLYDSIKKSYTSYRKVLTNECIDDKFYKILKSVLDLFQSLLESSIDTNDIITHIDEIQSYLKILFKVNSTDTTKCVTKLIRSLFGKNVVNLYFSHKSKHINQINNLNSHTTQLKNQNLYTILLKNNLNEFYGFINSLNHNNLLANIDFDCGTTHNDDLQLSTTSISNTKVLAKKLNNKYNANNQQNFIINLIRNTSSTKVVTASNNETQKQIIDTKFISQHIRSFEFIVIKALRQYTITSLTNLQYYILELLNELLLLKVNYALLDSEYVFIEYILKQFDYLEQRQTNPDAYYYENNEPNDKNLDDDEFIGDHLAKFKNTKKHVAVEHKRFHILVPKIYEFLINIAFEFTNNRKLNIINIPKLIQICNNLLASENSPNTHVIPALNKLVTNNRLLKLTNDIQQDMLIQTLLKLIDYPKVWFLLSTMLRHIKESNNLDKYNKLSRNIFDTLFIALNKNQLKFSGSLVKNFEHLLLLLSSLSTQVYRPIDMIIISFIKLKNENNDSNGFIIYLVHIYLLLVYSNNEEVLMDRLRKYIESNSEADTVLHLIHILFTNLLNCIKELKCNTSHYNLLIHYIYILFYVLNSGYFKKLSFYLKSYINDYSDENNVIENINKIVIKNISKSNNFSLLSYYWQYLLLSCNYNNNKYWSLILVNNSQSPDDDDDDDDDIIIDNEISLNEKLFKMVTLILYCDYINNNEANNDNLLLILFSFTNIKSIFELYHKETCITDIVYKVHRKQSLSLLYLQTINQNFVNFYSNISCSNCVNNMYICLKTIEGLHLNISSDIINFLVDKYINNLNLNKYICLIRFADYIVCQRIEMLNILSINDLSMNLNLNKVYFMNLLNFFQNFKYAYRHTYLVSLIKKFIKKFEDGEAKVLNSQPVEYLKNDIEKFEFNSILNLDNNISFFKYTLLNLNNNKNLKHKNYSYLMYRLDSLPTFNHNNIKLLKYCLLYSKTEYLHTLYKILIEHLANFKLLNNHEGKYDLYEYIMPLNECTNILFMKQFDFSNENDINDIISYIVTQFNIILIDKPKTLYYLYQNLLLIYNLFNNEKIVSVFLNHKNYLNTFEDIIHNLCKNVLIKYFYSNFWDDILINVPKANIDFSNHRLENNSEDFGNNNNWFKIDFFNNLLCIRYILKILIKKKEFCLINTVLRKIFVAICNNVIVINRFFRVADALWNTGYQLDYHKLLINNDDVFLNELILYIKENVIILKEYLNHILNLNYYKRIQYEYEYFNMLTILYSLTNQLNQDSLGIESVREQNKCKCILIKALSTWIIKSTLDMEKNVYEFKARNKNPIVLSKNKSYENIRDFIESSMLHHILETWYFNQNHERILISNGNFYFNQVNLEYIRNSMSNHNNHSLIKIKNLDITTLLRTIIDYYETLYYSTNACLNLKYDIYKSLIYLNTTLFNTSEQFNLMHSKISKDFNFSLLTNNDSSNQSGQTSVQQFDLQQEFVLLNNDLIDDTIIGLTFYGEILCNCCLNNSINVDKIQKLIDYCLNNYSSSIFIKISILQGLLYMSELLALDDNMNEKFKQLFEFMCIKLFNINTDSLNSSNIIYTMTLYSLIFYVIENCFSMVKDINQFIQKLLLYPTTNIYNTSYLVFKQYIYGIERLLLTNTLPSNTITSILKNLSKFSCSNEKYLAYFTLLQYTNIQAVRNNNNVNDNILEVITNLFDRVKLCKTVNDSCICAYVLPNIIYMSQKQAKEILNDLLNKLITEFLNIKQYMYPELLAYIVFKSFNLLSKYRNIIQEWCLLSLENFLQFHNTTESIWLITCLLLSISKYSKIRNLFFVVINRFGFYDVLDESIFHISVYYFQKQLKDCNQSKQLFNIFNDHNIKYSISQLNKLIRFLETANDRIN